MTNIKFTQNTLELKLNDMSVKVFEIHFRSRDMVDLELVFSWSDTVNTL